MQLEGKFLVVKGATYRSFSLRIGIIHKPIVYRGLGESERTNLRGRKHIAKA